MKTILIATDFSDNAKAAGLYGAHLAKAAGANIYLLHVTESLDIWMAPVSADTYDKMQADTEKALKHDAREIKKLMGNDAKVKSEVVSGFITYEILSFAMQKKADLIIMGARSDNWVMQALEGSTINEVIRQTEVPVLIIPGNSEFQDIRKIIFACNDSSLINAEVLNVIDEFTGIFNAGISVVDLMKDKAKEFNHARNETNKMKAKLHSHIADIYLKEGTDVAEDVNDLATISQADMIAVVKLHHTILDRIFHPVYSEKLARLAAKPLLIIPSNGL